MASQRYNPLLQLTLARLREFYREPAAVFWVYCFPLVMAVVLGIAFRERPVQKVIVDVREDAGSPKAVVALKERLEKDDQIEVHWVSGDEWMQRLRSGKTDLVVAPAAGGGFEIWDE